MTKALTTAALALALAPAAFGQGLASTVNNNNFLPAPPIGTLNVQWQQDGGRPTVNVSAYVRYPTIQVACPGGGDLSAPVVAALGALNSSNGGIIDARACTAATTWTGTVTLSTPATVILFPCATIEAFNTLTIGAGIRNVALRGCAYQGGSAASGTNGGTVWRFIGSGPAFSVGDPTYAVDTQGFEISNFNINTVNASNTSPAIRAYRSQQLYFHALYINGDGQTTQPGLYFDGTGNYTGGVFSDIHIAQEGLALVAVGDETGLGEDDYMNASTFVGLHIDCTTSSGSPISAVTGLDIAGGDGNTFTGADIEGCGIAVHLGAYATSNTFSGVRSENSIWQYYAEPYSSFNVITGGSTIEQGELYDEGAQNSWQDGFHRDFSQINGDRYASQEDATVTNHYRLGVGAGAERGLQNEVQTDYGNRWQYGFSDGTTGEQFYFLTDLLNSVQRLSIGQYLSATAGTVTNVIVNSGGCYASSTAPTLSFTGGGGSGAAATANMVTSRCSGGWAIGTVTVTTPGSSYTTDPTTGVSGGSQVSAPRLQAEITTAGSTNNQTALSAAGTGAVVINGTANSGTGGLVVDSGGATPTAVASVDSAGNLQMQGNAEWYLSSTLEWEIEAANTSNFIIRCPACTVPADILIAYNNGATEIDSQGTAAVVLNNHTFGGTGGLLVYGGGSSYYNTKLFSVTETSGTGVYDLPGIAATNPNHYCVQVDDSGYLSNTGSACGTGSGSGSVTSVGLSLPAQFSVANSPVTNSGTLTATWISQAGHSFLAGLDSSSTGTPTFRAIAVDDVPTLNQSTSGNAATATASDHSPAQCSSGLYSQGDTTGWAANCATVQYSQLGGSVPTWNQSTTGNAATATTTTGNAATATALAATPGQCSSGNYATGIATAGTANCGAVQYSQLGGTVTTWNQNTTGTAAGITQAASIHIDNSAGANYVCINCDNNTGTSGFVVQNGTGSSPTTEFQVTGSGNTTATGFVASKGWSGNYAATFTAGAAAGSGPTIGCLSGHTCTNIQGTVSILTGTLPTTGTLVTINFNHTQNNKLDCATTLSLAGTGQLTTYEAVSTTTTLPITIDTTALVTATTYTLTYVCGSY